MSEWMVIIDLLDWWVSVVSLPLLGLYGAGWAGHLRFGELEPAIWQRWAHTKGRAVLIAVGCIDLLVDAFQADVWNVLAGIVFLLVWSSAWARCRRCAGGDDDDQWKRRWRRVVETFKSLRLPAVLPAPAYGGTR